MCFKTSSATKRFRNGDFKCVQAQKDLDEYLYEQLWGFVDNPRTTRKELTRIFQKSNLPQRRNTLKNILNPAKVNIQSRINSCAAKKGKAFWRFLPACRTGYKLKVGK